MAIGFGDFFLNLYFFFSSLFLLLLFYFVSRFVWLSSLKEKIILFFLVLFYFDIYMSFDGFYLLNDCFLKNENMISLWVNYGVWCDIGQSLLMDFSLISQINSSVIFEDIGDFVLISLIG